MDNGKPVNPQSLLDSYVPVLLRPGYENQCDPEIKSIITKLNCLDGIVTTDSCASHPEPDRGYHQLYVAAMVTDPGLTNFMYVFERLVREVSEDDRLTPYRQRIQIRCRHRLISRLIDEWAWIWAISVDIRSHDDKQRILSILEKAVDHALIDRQTRPL